MRRLLTLLLAMVGALHLAQAQDIRGGVQLSPSFSWMTTDDRLITANGTNLGLKIGLIGEYAFRENYSFCTGVNLFNNTGGTLLHQTAGHYWKNVDYTGTGIATLDTAGVAKLDVLAAGTSLKYRLRYWEVPLSLKMRTADNDGLRFFAELPIITLGFRSKVRGDIKGGAIDVADFDIKEEVNALSMSWGLGAGVEYPLGGVSAVGGIYFHQGFTDVTGDDGTKAVANTNGVLETRSETSKAVINVLTFRLGVMF